jgi:hypothetical protein
VGGFIGGGVVVRYDWPTVPGCSIQFHRTSL